MWNSIFKIMVIFRIYILTDFVSLILLLLKLYCDYSYVIMLCYSYVIMLCYNYVIILCYNKHCAFI